MQERYGVKRPGSQLIRHTFGQSMADEGTLPPSRTCWGTVRTSWRGTTQARPRRSRPRTSWRDTGSPVSARRGTRTPGQRLRGLLASPCTWARLASTPRRTSWRVTALRIDYRQKLPAPAGSIGSDEIISCGKRRNRLQMFWPRKERGQPGTGLVVLLQCNQDLRVQRRMMLRKRAA